MDEPAVDEAVRNVLRLAARVGALDGAPPVVTDLPAPLDGDALAREVARRSFVLVRNEVRGDHPVLPVDPARAGTVALSGAAARDARILGGGSAVVFPHHIVSPLDGLTTALPEGALTYSLGADPSDELADADKGFELTAVCRAEDGRVLGTSNVPGGRVQWAGSDLPDGVTHDTLHTVELTGRFVPRESGEHAFGTRGLGGFVLTVDGGTLFDGTQEPGDAADPFEAFFGTPVERAHAVLTAGEPVEVSLLHTVFALPDAPIRAVAFSLLHLGPRYDPDELIAEAVEAARGADTAVVVVATTARVESEGFDRTSLRLPGRQDDLVRAVAAVNPHTVVVVNTGSPVELPWREDVAAVLLSWFPGQEGGAALADVLLGAEEPGGQAAHHLAGDPRGRARLGDDPDRRPTALRRGPVHRLPRLGEGGHHPRVPLRTRPRLHRLGVRDALRHARRRTGPAAQLRCPYGPRGGPDLRRPDGHTGRRTRGGPRAPGPLAGRLRLGRGGPGGDGRGPCPAAAKGVRDLGRADGRLGAGLRNVRDRGLPLGRRPPPHHDDRRTALTAGPSAGQGTQTVRPRGGT